MDELDFRGANLRGADFREKNLSGIDFSSADIRGANFSGAILRNANLENAQAGLSIAWRRTLIIIAIIISLFSGLVIGYSGAIIGDLLVGLNPPITVTLQPVEGFKAQSPNIEDDDRLYQCAFEESPQPKEFGEYVIQYRCIPYVKENVLRGRRTTPTVFFGVVSIIIFIFLLSLIFWLGLREIVVLFSEIISACLIALMALAPENAVGLDIVLGVKFTALSLIGLAGGVGHIAVTVAMARAIALSRCRILIAGISSFGALLGILFGVRIGVEIAMPTAVSIALLAIGSALYIGWSSFDENRKYRMVRFFSIALVARGGTCFQGADLTDASFKYSLLRNSNFRNSKLIRTNWFSAEGLEWSSLRNTYLEKKQIRDLLVFKRAVNQNFDYLDLRELNLDQAELVDSSFISSNFSGATLQEANLRGTKLVKTQLHQVNLSGACLTGACIEDWGISIETSLDNVMCEFIYTRLPTKEDPDPCRKPDNKLEVFNSDDFADFIRPIVRTLNLYKKQYFDMRQVGNRFKTLDLFYHQDVDARAAASALNQLVEKYPDADIEVLSLEGLGKKKVHLQAKVSPDALPSQLSVEYDEIYQSILSSPSSEVHSSIVAEKNERIHSLEKMLENALKQPRYYVETYASGDYTMTEERGNINISGISGSVSGVAASAKEQSMTGVAIGEISGRVTNAIDQLSVNSGILDEVDIQELLTELQVAIVASSKLEEEDKVDALDQVKAIAEAGQVIEEIETPKLVKTALKILKGTIAELPETAPLVKTFTKVSPLIKLFFSLS